MEEAAEFIDLAAAVRGARKRAGMTQREAAERAGVSERGWQDWELGKGDAVANLTQIEDALGLTRGHLVAQLTVLGRLLRFSQQMDEIQSSLEDVLERQRGIEALLKLLVN